MNGGNEPNTGTGQPEIAWIGRLVTKVEMSVDKLADKVDQMRQAIAVDQERMRDAFRTQVHDVDNRVDSLERELVRLKMIASIGTAIAMVVLVGLGAIAVPRMFGNHPTVQQSK